MQQVAQTESAHAGDGANLRLRRSEARLEALLTSVGDLVIECDENGTYLDVWTQNAALLVAPREDLIGQNVREVLPGDTGRSVLSAIRRTFRTGDNEEVEYRLEVPAGARWFQLRTARVTSPDEPATVVLAVRDVSAQREAEAAEREASRALAENEQRFRLLFRANPTPMWVYELETFRFLEVNEAAVDHYGYTRDEFLGMTIYDIRAEEEGVRLRTYLKSGRSSPRQNSGPWRHRRKSGEVIDVEISSDQLEIAGRSAVLVTIKDVTEQLEATRALVHQAMHDSLTGLPNRILLLDRIEHALSQSARDRSALAVIFIDLDRFKVINDAKGHSFGDSLLVQIARRMEQTIRPSDTLARIGGDEFVIMLEGLHLREEAATAARRILGSLKAPFELAGESFSIGASQGIAIAEPGESAEQILSKADAAMYLAKERGRGRYEFADDKILSAAVSRLEIELDLRLAVEHEQFVLHYQPIVRVATGEIVGAEALIRWNHPRLGLLSPDRFIPSAEESGLIVPIGEWVLRQALNDAKEWQDYARPNGSLSVAVNLSASQLMVPSLPFVVARALSFSGLQPECLHLEITESVLVGENSRCIETIMSLRGLGIHVAIDDFGTQYSTLSYVQRLPIDVLKIDKSFIDQLQGTTSDTSIVEAVLNMARSLRLAVVAEGVESRAQFTALKELGCDLAQGYYFARPTPLAGLFDLMRAGTLPTSSRWNRKLSRSS